jgi:hypothetical protein
MGSILHVCLGSKAEKLGTSGSCSLYPQNSFDRPVGAAQQRQWEGNAEHFGSLAPMRRMG